MSKSGTRRVRRTAGQWEALLAEQARSGLTQEAFCRMRGLVYSTFGMWRARLRGKVTDAGVKRRSITPRAAFIELPSFAPPVLPTRIDSALHVELELGGGMVLRIGRR
jgi:hypothetical protein